MSDAQVQEYRFDRFRLRPAERQLLVDGQPVRLGGRAFDLLLALLERRSRTVTRAELFELVWPGRVVEDQNLQVQVVALRKLLGPNAIATVPGRGYRFALPLHEARPDATATPPVAASPAAVAAPALPTNLPAELPPLYGRTQDIVAVLRLLDEHRLVTLAGPGGIGKTRLALAVAGQLRARFPDGTWFVDLAPLADGERIAIELARALGFAPSAELSTPEGIGRAVSAMSMLLVIDNCEHLLAAAAHLVQTLRAAAPGVRLLVTGQEPLHLADEQVFRLAPLAVPETPGTNRAATYGAVALFIARVQAMQPGFTLRADNEAAVIDVCRRLDGIPLALELAAARVPLLGIEGVRARLHERLRLLTAGRRDAPTRQQTLGQALEWSHGLLSSEQQTVFRRLAVFAGSFALESAQQVAADEAIDVWAVLDHLGALVDKSLVQVLDGAPPRYRLLESTRAFAGQRLAAAGETALLRERHARHLRAAWEQHEIAGYQEPTMAWLERHLPDLDNLRAALGWACAEAARSDIAAALLMHTMRFWLRAGLGAEAVRWATSARQWLDAAADEGTRHRFAFAAAMLSVFREDAFPAQASLQHLERAQPYFAADPIRHYMVLHVRYVLVLRLDPQGDRSSVLAQMRALEQPQWSEMLTGFRRMNEAQEHYLAGHSEEYLAFCRDELAVCERLGARAEGWIMARHLMLAEYQAGRLPAAVDVGRRTYAEVTAGGWLRQQDVTIGIWTWMAAEHGDVAAARQACVALLPIVRGEGLVWRIGLALAWLAAHEGRPDEAAQILGWYLAATAAVGQGVRGPASNRSAQRLMQRLQDSIGAGPAQRRVDAGAALDETAVVRLGLGDGRAIGARAAD